jgi:hypothetical protein
MDERTKASNLVPSDTAGHHCSTLEVFAVTDPNLAQTGAFISWIASDEEAEDLQFTSPDVAVRIREVRIATADDVDVEVATALRNRCARCLSASSSPPSSFVFRPTCARTHATHICLRLVQFGRTLCDSHLPVPPEAWFRRAAEMQLLSTSAADVEYCQMAFRSRVMRVRALYALDESLLAASVHATSFHDVQLALYARALQSGLSPPAWPLALTFFGAFVGPDKTGAEEKPYPDPKSENPTPQLETESR